MLAPQLAFVAETPEGPGLFDGARNLNAWVERMKARPSIVATTWDCLAAQAQAA